MKQPSCVRCDRSARSPHAACSLDVAIIPPNHAAMKPEPPPLEWIDGTPHFRGLAVETREVTVGPRTYRLLGLRDAADLLDEPDYAKQFVEDDLAPYGMELWPAATMLARYIAEHDPGHGRQAIELGAGLGLVAMAATQAGWHVTVTDHEPTSLAFAACNASLNDVEHHDYDLLDWNEPPTERRYVRVFAADVLYQLVDHAPLLRCLDALLRPDGTSLIADPCRGVADRFPDLATEAGFALEIIETKAANHAGETVKGRIFRLGRTK